MLIQIAILAWMFLEERRGIREGVGIRFTQTLLVGGTRSRRSVV